MTRFAHILLILAFLGMIAAAGVFAWGVVLYKASGPLATDRIVFIKPGTSTRGIAEALMHEGLLDVSGHYVFLAATKMTGAKLKAGEYEFKAGASIEDAIRLLQSGKTYQRKITVPEGLMVIEIAELLQNEPALTGDIGALPPEGSLLPETYSFSRGDARQALITRMQESMKSSLNEQWGKRAENLPLKTPEEAVILASIVEKETGIAAERPRVAGVFINRLNRGQALQSDPTVIYAVTEGKKKLERPLTFKDLKIASPYNTYIVSGLPPTPIANPGKASLAAVLNPEKHDYIYFVADGTGGHAFAATLDAHNKNVARWRQVQKKIK